MIGTTKGQSFVTTICQVLFVLWLIYLPINLFWKFEVNSAYVHGRLVDYLIPKIFATDLLMSVIILLNLTKATFRLKLRTLIKNIFSNPNQLIILALVVVLGLLQFTTEHMLLTTLAWMRLILIATFGVTLSIIKSSIKPVLLWGLIMSLCIQLVVGVLQFINQVPLVSYWLLGESRINQVIDISKFVWRGQERVLAYASTAHPNILAGFIVILSLWLLEITRKRKLKISGLILSNSIFKWLFVSLNLITLIMTQSWSGGVGLVFGMSWLIFRTKLSVRSRQNVFSVLVFICLILLPFIIHFTSLKWSTTSVVRRDYLNQSALAVWQQHPIWGVGLSNITAHIEEPKVDKEVVRFVQPPHHIGLVWLSETGLIGLLLAYLLFKQLLLKRSGQKQLMITAHLVALLPIAGLDHYLLTTQTGLLILLLTALSFIKLNDK